MRERQPIDLLIHASPLHSHQPSTHSIASTEHNTHAHNLCISRLQHKTRHVHSTQEASKGAGAPIWLASAFPFRSPPTGPKQGTFSSRPAPCPNPSISPSGGSMPAAMETLRRRQDRQKKTQGQAPRAQRTGPHPPAAGSALYFLFFFSLVHSQATTAYTGTGSSFSSPLLPLPYIPWFGDFRYWARRRLI